jgi:hypothetical protein
MTPSEGASMETIGPPTIFYMHFIRTKSILVLCLLNGALVTSAYSENWKSVGEGFYVDLDSSKRRGDIGTVNTQVKGEHSDANFDCKNRLYIRRNGEAISVDKWYVLAEMLEIACTRWYEVWKK